MQRDKDISKTLTKILRYQIHLLNVTENGFVSLNELCNLRDLSRFNIKDVETVARQAVTDDGVKRYNVSLIDGQVHVRAASTRRAYGTKYWYGFSFSLDDQIKNQVEAIIRKRLTEHKFHFTVGWSKIGQDLYSRCCQNALSDLTEILTEFSTIFRLKFSHIQKVGIKRSTAIVFKPIKSDGSDDQELVESFSERFKNVWRNAAQEYASFFKRTTSSIKIK